jgi:hypothetical protein
MAQQPDTSQPDFSWLSDQHDIGPTDNDQLAQLGQMSVSTAVTRGTAQDRESGTGSIGQTTTAVARFPSLGRSPSKAHHSSLVRIVALLVLVALLGGVSSASGFGFSTTTHTHNQASQSPAPTASRRQTLPGSPTAILRSSLAPTPRPTQTSRPSPTAVPPPVILAQDDFQRPNQTLWGSASDGSVWGGDANTAPVFSIVAGAGRITGGQGFFNAILGPRTVSEVVTSGSVSHFDSQRDNLGAVLRWSNDANYYKAYLDGAQLVLIKRVAGTVTRLGAVPFSARDGASYSLRFRILGSQLQVRAWPSPEGEPTTWMITASDRTLAFGFAGLRVMLENGVTVTVTAYRELA